MAKNVQVSANGLLAKFNNASQPFLLNMHSLANQQIIDKVKIDSKEGKFIILKTLTFSGRNLVGLPANEASVLIRGCLVVTSIQMNLFVFIVHSLDLV